MEVYYADKHRTGGINFVIITVNMLEHTVGDNTRGGLTKRGNTWK